jgi:tRNA(adenine34) deaminase
VLPHEQALGTSVTHLVLGTVLAGARWHSPSSSAAITGPPTIGGFWVPQGALGLARVARVVFGAWEPKARAVGSLWDVLRDRRLNHRPRGGGRDQCAALLEGFFAAHR